MRKMRAIARLPEEMEDLAYDMILEGKLFDDIAQAMGLKSKQNFARYQLQHPEFQELVQSALLAQCPFLEEQMLNLTDNMNDKYAKVQMEIIAKILKYRDPKRYGDKVAVDMNMTIDIAGALERAERRVLESGTKALETSNVVQLLKTEPEKTDD